ncbi:MAG: amidohydrolase family protein [Chloroflexota bacterium]|nr:amidohydrolase family protein [Chloroflexota bacterium]
MIIDGDVHISPTPQGGNSIGIDELLRRMDRAGVAKAVTWLQPPYVRHEIDAGNAYVASAMRDHPDRIIGFGWADPNLGVERAIDDVRRAVEEHGFFGVKLNGAQNDFRIDDPYLAMPVVEAVARAGVALALHVGADAYDQTHPSRVATIARAFPELRILVVHMGGAAFHDLSAAAIDVAQAHPNLTLVGSAVRAIPILRAVKTLGAERVCFGSDTPFELMHVELAKYRALLDGEVTEAERDLVLGGNIARLLGLDVRP